MIKRVEFHSMAECEVNEAASYYDNESLGLGSAFLDSLEQAIQQIFEYPEASSLINRVVRRKVIRRFPYNVMYSISNDKIRILAVANQKRRPFYWMGRE